MEDEDAQDFENDRDAGIVAARPEKQHATVGQGVVDDDLPPEKGFHEVADEPAVDVPARPEVVEEGDGQGEEEEEVEEEGHTIDDYMIEFFGTADWNV